MVIDIKNYILIQVGQYNDGYEGGAINIMVQTTNTGDTGNITWESGVVPFIPKQIDSTSKYFSTSGIVFYIDRDRLAHEEKRP